MKNTLVALVLAALVPAVSQALEPGSLGLVYQVDPVERIWFNPEAQYGPSDINLERLNGVGAVYQMSAATAIKGMFLFDVVNYTVEVDGDDVAKWDAAILGVEVELLFPLKTLDRLSVLLAPAARIVWVNNKDEDLGTDDEEVLSAMEIGLIVSLSARWMISDRFAVFGQWGLGLAYSSIDFEETGFDTVQVRGFAIHTDQAGIGLIFFVK